MNTLAVLLGAAALPYIAYPATIRTHAPWLCHLTLLGFAGICAAARWLWPGSIWAFATVPALATLAIIQVVIYNRLVATPGVAAPNHSDPMDEWNSCQDD